MKLNVEKYVLLYNANQLKASIIYQVFVVSLIYGVCTIAIDRFS